MNTNAQEPDKSLTEIPDFLKRKKGEQPAATAASRAPAKTQPAKAKKANGKAENQPVGREPEPAKGNPPAKAKRASPAKKSAAKKPEPKAKPKASKKVVKAKAKMVVADAKKKRKEAELDAFGFKVGSIMHKAGALYAQKSGATTDEMKEKFGGAQLNLLKAAEQRGHTVKKVKEKNDKGHTRTRYFLVAKKG